MRPLTSLLSSREAVQNPAGVLSRSNSSLVARRSSTALQALLMHADDETTSRMQRTKSRKGKKQFLDITTSILPQTHIISQMIHAPAQPAATHSRNLRHSRDCLSCSTFGGDPSICVMPYRYPALRRSASRITAQS